VTELGYDQSPTTYDSDSVWSYELGTKNSFAGGRVTIDASAFYIKWSDIQTSLYLPTCGSSFIANTGKATSKGFDLALQARPTDAVTLGAVFGYTHATYDEDVLGGNGLLLFGAGDFVYQGPEISFTLSGQYDFALMDNDRGGFVRFDYSYGSPGPDNNPDAFGYDPINTNGEETHVVNARAGLRKGALEVSLFLDNLTNAHPELARYHLFPTSPLITNATLRPRTVGLTAAFRY
jgi:outer membrane receptor protein involved in Fe transport